MNNLLTKLYLTVNKKCVRYASDFSTVWKIKPFKTNRSTIN